MYYYYYYYLLFVVPLFTLLSIFSRHSRAQSLIINVLDIRTLDHLDISVVGSDDEHDVDMQGHPEPVTEGDEHHLQVDVVTADQPETEDNLEEDDEAHQDLPRQDQATDGRPDAEAEKNWNQTDSRRNILAHINKWTAKCLIRMTDEELSTNQVPYQKVADLHKSASAEN